VQGQQNTIARLLQKGFIVQIKMGIKCDAWTWREKKLQVGAGLAKVEAVRDERKGLRSELRA
jgi:hypothetical protein